MEYFICLLFRATAYTFFGLCMEIMFTALSSVIDKNKTIEEKNLIGHVSLYMIPVYGIFIAGLFEPVHSLMLYIGCAWYVRYVIYAILISAIEALCGWFYDKFLHRRPWDYSTCKDKIFKNGYTRWSYVPLWGIAGLIIEVYSIYLLNLGTSPYKAFELTKQFLGI